MRHPALLHGPNRRAPEIVAGTPGDPRGLARGGPRFVEVIAPRACPPTRRNAIASCGAASKKLSRHTLGSRTRSRSHGRR